jgi:hypothetical protein
MNKMIYDNLKSSVIQMNAIVAKLKLIDLPNKPKQWIKGGKPTKMALKFNRAAIKAGKAYDYLDTSKLVRFTEKGNLGIINKKFDTRYKKPTLIKAQKKLNVFGSVIVRGSASDKSFRYVAQGDDEVPSWMEGSDPLYNNDLLRTLIQDNNIKGDYRILIKINSVIAKDKSYLITSASKFWKDYRLDYQYGSEFMIWNNPAINEGDVVHFIFTKEKLLTDQYYQQKFLDGKVSHCLLQPIMEWAKEMIAGTKSKDTKKRYNAIISKLEGKKPVDKRNKGVIGYLEKYKDGIPETELSNFCEDLQIGMDIEQPFNENLLFEYRSVKKCCKVFKFINTRLNHVDFVDDSNFGHIQFNSLFKTFEPIPVLKGTMLEFQKQLDDANEFYVYTKNSYGISSIRSLTNYLILKSDFSDTVREFEQSHIAGSPALKDCSIDAKKYPELQNFIDLGTHFNGTIDFKETKNLKNESNRPASLKHIDMTKAYTQFKNCKYYDGFMMQITDFRKTNKIVSNGLYYVEDIDLTNCAPKFIEIMETVGWYHSYNVYTKEELEALTKYGGKYTITAGCWGARSEFDFGLLNQQMLSDKETIMVGDKEISIPYYSKWAGMNCMVNEKKNFWVKGDEKYFKSLNADTSIYYAEGEARIAYDNTYQYNKKHITAQITAYQRLQMLDQMMEMDVSKIYRICCDGIYYEAHDFKIDKVFSPKTKITFNNEECEDYLSGIIVSKKDRYIDFDSLAPFRENYKTEIFDGAGGDGKTYHNLFIDTGLVNVVYAPHSNKLMSAMSAQYLDHFGTKLTTTNHHRLLNEPYATEDTAKYSVYVIDECSMLTEKQKEQLMKTIKGKIIFCGDLSCQCEPVYEKRNRAEEADMTDEEKAEEAKNYIQMTYDGIDNIAEQSPKNWRFDDTAQLKAANYLRSCIKNKKLSNMKLLPYQVVDKYYVKANYGVNDIILVSQHKYNDQWTKAFKKLEKYKVTNNTRDYKNGDVCFKKMKNVTTELRHGYTVHSVQGETFTNNIYIDMRSMTSARIFYTAISRAKYSSQIYLVK